MIQKMEVEQTNLITQFILIYYYWYWFFTFDKP